MLLESLLNGLPREVFLADDSLGWVYQFWQAKKKEEVNKSGKKIGGADISPVTQLFTEHYMVEFLLHNSLGAWWAARHPDEPLPVEMTYLRRNEDDTPVAGVFPGWPDRAAELKILDPCCGSGHFLVAAFDLLRWMRMAEEGLNEAEAGDAVLRDNLFGLELDPRCTQIAVFAICLTAWKVGGYRLLPLPNVACSGLAVGDRLYEWVNLAGGDNDLEATLRRLYHLFREASDLGSLIDPARVAAEDHLYAIAWARVAPLLEKALTKERDSDDPGASVFGETAKGVLRAANLLAGQYHLVITNVPYLATRKQGKVLFDFLAQRHYDAKFDLATAFVERCLSFCTQHGTSALVTPQNWLFLGSYKRLRERLLKENRWNIAAKLGPGAFETISGEVVNVVLFAITKTHPQTEHLIHSIDASVVRAPSQKAEFMRCSAVQTALQADQLRNPDARITLVSHADEELLQQYADGLIGIMNGDSPHFQRLFWEMVERHDLWHFQQSTVATTAHFGGCEMTIFYDKENGHLRERAEIRRKHLHDSDRRGRQAWGKWGVAVSSMGTLPTALYMGDLFDNNTAVVLPKDPTHLPAIWCFCSSPEFNAAVRRIDQKMNVTNATLVKVPFDLERWQQVAAEQYPDGLPELHSDDPTQWLYHGHPARSTDPLQVALARLLGYQWPEHGLPSTPSGRSRQEEDGLNAFADADGILCLPMVAREPPATQSLRALLVTAYGAEWSPAVEQRLLSEVGYGGKELEEWLRDGFFAQHCRLFHSRPFLWHIWDGEKDGFSAIVNYHRLDRAALDKLTYTYIGEWIDRQRKDDSEGIAGAGRRLKAALTLQEKLKAIAHGEPPYDIYVRWKPLQKQPIGWEPDLNDGVRLNIRPFVTAEILRVKKPSINWNKDRGNDPTPNLSGTTERHNDLHFTRTEKEAARRNPPPGDFAPTTKASETLNL